MEQEKDRLDQYFNEQAIHEPSTDFTNLVKERVQEMAETPFVFKPLISRKGWIYIVLTGTLVILSSFSIELADTFYELPAYLRWESINFQDFETSIKIAGVVLSLLIVLTIADIAYRKMKNIA